MSHEQARMFLDAAQQDPALRSLVQSYQSSGEINRLRHLGRERGYEFSDVEIQQALTDYRPIKPASSSLALRDMFFSYKHLTPKQIILLLVLAYLLVSIGIVVTFVISRNRQSYECEACTAFTRGWPVDRWEVEKPGIRTSSDYYMSFRYSSYGQEFIFSQEVSQAMYDDFSVYREVEILYNPDRPNEAILKEHHRSVLWAVAEMLGFVFVIILLWARVQIMRQRAIEQKSSLMLEK